MSILLLCGNLFLSRCFLQKSLSTLCAQILNIFSTNFLLFISHYILSFFFFLFVFSFSIFPLCYLLLWASDIYSFYTWNWVVLLPFLLFFQFLELHVCVSLMTNFSLLFWLQPWKSSLVFLVGLRLKLGFYLVQMVEDS